MPTYPILYVFGKRRLRYGGKIKFGWKLAAANGKVIAVDGRQDYNHAVDAEDMARNILGGRYNNFQIKFV